MRKDLSAFAATLALTVAATSPLAARADAISIVSDDGAAPLSVALPRRGELRTTVLRSYGEPQRKHAPAGGDSPKHPAITRWDYASFSVFFEHEHVVDAVVPGRPVQVYHADKLQRLRDTY